MTIGCEMQLTVDSKIEMNQLTVNSKRKTNQLTVDSYKSVIQ